MIATTRLRALWVLCTVVFAWLGGAAAAQVHTLVVEHVRCAEHGEWIDSEAAAEASDAAGEQAVDDRDDDADHEHGCAFAGAPLVARAVLPPVVAVAPVDSRPELVHAAYPTPPPAAPVLSYAPKTSPPRNA